MRLRAMREEHAQATVEMAVVAPVMLVVALIVYNVMVFASATARFDRVAPDIVLAHGVAPAGDATGALSMAGSASNVEERLERAMDGYDVEVDVEAAEQAGGDSATGGSLLHMVGSLRTYRCTMRYVPWPQGLVVAGVDMGAPLELTHTRSITVDPWRPGVVM